MSVSLSQLPDGHSKGLSESIASEINDVLRWQRKPLPMSKSCLSGHCQFSKWKREMLFLAHLNETCYVFNDVDDSIVLHSHSSWLKRVLAHRLLRCSVLAASWWVLWKYCDFLKDFLSDMMHVGVEGSLNNFTSWWCDVMWIECISNEPGACVCVFKRILAQSIILRRMRCNVPLSPGEAVKALERVKLMGRTFHHPDQRYDHPSRRLVESRCMRNVVCSFAFNHIHHTCSCVCLFPGKRKTQPLIDEQGMTRSSKNRVHLIHLEEGNRFVSCE